MSDELTARLVTDRLNGIDTIALAYEEVRRHAKISVTPLNNLSDQVILMFINEFTPTPSNVGDFIKNEMFAHKVIITHLYRTFARIEHIIYHENKLESLHMSFYAMNWG